MMRSSRVTLYRALLAVLVCSTAHARSQSKVRLSWGHASAEASPFHVRLLSREAAIADIHGLDLEPGDREGDTIATRAGGGDVDGVEFTLRYAPMDIGPSGKVHQFWTDYLAQCDAETARRLKQDPAYRPDPRRLTVQLDSSGTKGFTLTVDQLLANKAFWVPSLDVYVAVGDDAPSFEEHRRQLDAHRGTRILDQVRREPEATYERYTSRWEDMGSPSYKHLSQPAPGHIVGLTWDSALYKFGIDRWAGVWNDYGNSDRFRFRLDCQDSGENLAWHGHPAHASSAGSRDTKGQDALATSQRLQDGLPVITTTLEQEDLRYEIEQFAYPLHGPPEQRRGDIPMVLIQKVTVTNRRDRSGPVSVRIQHRREFPLDDGSSLVWRNQGDTILFEESGARRVLFTVEGPGLTVVSCDTKDEAAKDRDKKR